MWWEGQEVIKGDGGAEKGMREKVFEVVSGTKQVRMAIESLGSEITPRVRLELSAHDRMLGRDVRWPMDQSDAGSGEVMIQYA